MEWSFTPVSRNFHAIQQRRFTTNYMILLKLMVLAVFSPLPGRAMPRGHCAGVKTVSAQTYPQPMWISRISSKGQSLTALCEADS
jgi:hypothetical protein